MTSLIGIRHALSFQISFWLKYIGFREVSRMTMDCPKISRNPCIRRNMVTAILIVSDWGVGQSSQNCNTPPSERFLQQGRTVREIWLIFRYRRSFSPANSVDLFLRLSLSLWKRDTSQDT